MAKAVAAGAPRRPRHRHARRDGRDRGPGHGHAREPPSPRRDPGRGARAGDGRPRRHRVGEPRLPRLRHDGSAGQPRPAQLLDGRYRCRGGAPDLARPPIPARRHHDVQRVRRVRPSRPHPRPTTSSIRAFDRAGDPAWYPEQLAEGGVEVWAPSKLYEQAMPASVRAKMAERMKELGQKSFWEPPEDATPEQVAEMEAFAAKMLVPDETHHDLDRHRRATRSSASGTRSTSTRPRSATENPFMAFGFDGWARVLVAGVLHPARVAHRDDASRDGPLRRHRLRPGSPARAAPARRAWPARATDLPGQVRGVLEDAVHDDLAGTRPGRGSWAAPCRG